MVYAVAFIIRWALTFYALVYITGLDFKQDPAFQSIGDTAYASVIFISWGMVMAYEYIRTALTSEARLASTLTTIKGSNQDQKTYDFLNAGTMNDTVYRHHLFHNPDL
tara:strand:+ start:7871 stop:8194 length:324 start_codon:yes stop_codon:yes gene_type:complete